MESPIHPKTVYEKLCQLDPQSPLSHFTLGRALYLEGNFQAALAAFGNCLEVDANYLLAYLLCGQTYEKCGQPAMAQQIYLQGRERARVLGDAHFEQQFAALGVTL